MMSRLLFLFFALALGLPPAAWAQAPPEVPPAAPPAEVIPVAPAPPAVVPPVVVPPAVVPVPPAVSPPLVEPPVEVSPTAPVPPAPVDPPAALPPVVPPAAPAVPPVVSPAVAPPAVVPPAALPPGEPPAAPAVPPVVPPAAVPPAVVPPAAPAAAPPVVEPAAPEPVRVAAKIAVSLSARSLAPGQQAVLSYQISGAMDGVESYPQSIEVPGLTVAYNGQTQRFVAYNGERRREISVRYTVLAGEPGEYAIPAQGFWVDGQAVQGPAAALVVRAAAEGAGAADELTPTVQLSLGKTEFWKGEVVPLQVAVLVHPAVQPLSPFFPQVKTPNFAVNRFDRTAGLEAREVNGEIWRAWQMESVMTALQPGAQEFGPAELKAELLMPLPGQPSDPFGRQQGNRRTLTLSSNKLKVNVKELPTEGKPSDFAGAVGDFEISVEASPVALKAGDPIAVEIAVSGTGNFDAVTAPRLESTEGWRLYEPRVSQENRAWGVEPGRKTFTQILIPEKPLSEIPPFVLHCFNPATGQYVSRRSAPIALTLTGEFKAEGSAAGLESKDFAAPADASAPQEELGDILDQPLRGGAWMATAAAPLSVDPLLRHGAPALLLAALLGAGGWRRWRAAAQARRPAEGAPRRPEQVMADLQRGAPSQRDFYRLVSEFLGSAQCYYQRPPLPSEALDGVLQARDRWVYGADDPAAHQPVAEAERRRTLEILRQF